MNISFRSSGKRKPSFGLIFICSKPSKLSLQKTTAFRAWVSNQCPSGIGVESLWLFFGLVGYPVRLPRFSPIRRKRLLEVWRICCDA